MGGAHVARDHRVPSDHVSRGHFVEYPPGFRDPAVFSVGSEERRPRDDVADGHAVEDGLGAKEIAISPAPGDPGVAGDQEAARLRVKRWRLRQDLGGRGERRRRREVEGRMEETRMATASLSDVSWQHYGAYEK